jgi:hypothetical protein
LCATELDGIAASTKTIFRRLPSPGGVVFHSAKKIYEVAQRGDGFIDMDSREALDEAVALSLGGI